MNRVEMLAGGSILVGVVVLALKSLAYFMTGSIALLSDAIESIVNVATAIAAFIAIRLSAKPADAEHPYGHHKAEYFSAVLEGVLIAAAAVAILREAYFAFHPDSWMLLGWDLQLMGPHWPSTQDGLGY
jgi:cation diffusion facilitator family transporter